MKLTTHHVTNEAY